MSFHAVSWALNQDIEPNKKMVLVAIASFANPYTGEIFPRVRLIAKRSSYSTRQVFRILNDLQDRNLIIRQNNFKGKARLSSNYYFGPTYVRKLIKPRVTTPGDTRVTPVRGIYKPNIKEERRALPPHLLPSIVRTQRNSEQVRDQESQNELARRLDPTHGWEMLSLCAEQEITHLSVKLRASSLTEQLLDQVRNRFYRLRKL